MQVLPPLIGSGWRLWVWLACLAAVFVPLERCFGLHRRGCWRAGAWRDLVYYFMSSLLPALLLAVPLALLMAVLRVVEPAGWLALVRGLPGWSRVLLGIVVGEVGAYWGHRCSHASPWLWRFHAVHHAGDHMDWLVHTRSHPVDMVFVRLCALTPVFALGLAQPTGLGAGVAALAQAASTVWGFFIHANLRWRFGVLERWLATPFFHHWHHSRQAPLDRNFAAVFPWVDRLFGTLHLPRDWPAAYGTDTPVAETLAAQLIDPLRPRRRTADTALPEIRTARR